MISAGTGGGVLLGGRPPWRGLLEKKMGRGAGRACVCLQEGPRLCGAPFGPRSLLQKPLSPGLAGAWGGEEEARRRVVVQEAFFWGGGERDWWSRRIWGARRVVV